MTHAYFIDNRETIPYNKALREYAGSISATILMQKLELYFANYPDGFCKPITDDFRHYNQRDCISWQRELGCTKEEFVSIFNQIGMRHRTKLRYQATLHPFFNNENQEKYYCSYHDSHTGSTWYFRNHILVDSLSQKLLVGGVCK